jgi:hypothetical protein
VPREKFAVIITFWVVLNPAAVVWSEYGFAIDTPVEFTLHPEK